MDAELEISLCLRLIMAAFLGSIIGYERETMNRTAGLRTHVMTAIGSALFTMLSIYFFDYGLYARDPARVAAQIVSGIGFLGAGAIMKNGSNIKGLTTASTLWAVAAIGMACGVGAFRLATASCLITLLGLILLRKIEDHLTGKNTVKINAAFPESTDSELIYQEIKSFSKEISKFEIEKEDKEINIYAVFTVDKITDTNELKAKLSKMRASELRIR